MKALVIGGDGRLGSALCTHLLDKGWGVVATTRKDQHSENYLDLEFPKLTNSMKAEFDAVFFVAAITAVVDCESNSQMAWFVNADGPANIALEISAIADNAKRTRPKLIFVSSDAVERAPNLVYSKAKAFAETIILSLGGSIVRPSRIPSDRFNDLAEFMENLVIQGGNKVYRWRT